MEMSHIDRDEMSRELNIAESITIFSFREKHCYWYILDIFSTRCAFINVGICGERVLLRRREIKLSSKTVRQ